MKNLNKLLRQFSLTLLALVFTSTAHATLIGDTVLLEHHFDNNVFGSFSVDVVADMSDAVDLPPSNLNAGNYYTVDMGANGATLDFTAAFPGVAWSNGSFNGLVMSGLDWVDFPNGIITGLNISTNFSGWSSSRATFSDHGVNLNFESLTFDSDTFLNVTFITQHSVPEPATLMLLSLGLFGLSFNSRKRPS